MESSRGSRESLESGEISSLECTFFYFLRIQDEGDLMLWDQMLEHGVKPAGELSDAAVDALRKITAHTLHDNSVFEITDVYEYFYASFLEKLFDCEGSTWIPISRIMPAYDSLFLEFHLPPELKDRVSRWSATDVGKSGVLISKQRLDAYSLEEAFEDGKPPLGGISTSEWVELAENKCSVLVFQVMFQIKSHQGVRLKHAIIGPVFSAGMLIDNEGFLIYKDRSRTSSLEYTTDNGLDLSSVWHYAHSQPNDGEITSVLQGVYLSGALYALSLLNCKNVEYVDNRPSEKIVKARRRKKQLPLCEYKTLRLVLTAKGRVVSRPSFRQLVVQSTEHGGTKLHKCAGHFKIGRAHV